MPNNFPPPIFESEPMRWVAYDDVIRSPLTHVYDSLVNSPVCVCGTSHCVTDPRLAELTHSRRADVLRLGPWRARARTLQSEAAFAFSDWTPEEPVVNLHVLFPPRHRTPDMWDYLQHLRSDPDAIRSVMDSRAVVWSRMDMADIENATAARRASHDVVARSFTPNAKRSLVPGDAPPRHIYPSSREFAAVLCSDSWLTGTPPVWQRDLTREESVPRSPYSLGLFMANANDEGGHIPTQAALLILASRGYTALGLIGARNLTYVPLTVTISDSDSNRCVVVFQSTDGSRQSAAVPIRLPDFDSWMPWRRGAYQFDLGWLSAALYSLHSTFRERV
jgi:hypothetical protein